MRILLDYRPALRERTGVGEYVHETAKALVETAPAGEQLTLFSASWKDRLPPGVVAGAQTVDRRVPVKMLNFAWHRLEWPRIERVTGQDFDVAASLHPLLIPSRRAAQVVTIHDLDFLDHPERTRDEVRRDYPALAAQHARRADHVVVVSEHTAGEVVRRFDVPRSRMTVCSPGVPEWPMRAHEPESDGSILFLGTLEPRKNVDMLVTAYEELASGRADVPPLVLAGRITAEAQALVDRVRRSSVAHRVQFPGYIQPERRHELYLQALVFVLPSYHEGFGMPAVEAMKAGVPVVAANRGALPEAVGDAGRLVDPKDPSGLARTLATLLDSPDVRRAMAERGRVRAARYTWKRTAEGYREALARAVEERRRRG